MKVIAEIDGWRKIIYVDEEAVKRGFFYITIQRPISMLISPKHIVKNDFGAEIIKLVKTRDNIFKYIP